MAPDITTTTAITKTTSLSKTPSQPRRAYVTFLAGNGDYVKGVVGLAKGLRKAKSKYPLVVAILPDVPEEHRKILVDQGCIVREIEPVYPPENSTQFAMAYYVINYPKLRIWEFVEYSKLIYLDGDIQVFENIDHLFDMPDGYFYGVMDCFRDEFEWPAELGPKLALYFNASMFVFEPSISTYNDLLNTLNITPPTPFAEQDFLNKYFKDIYRPVPPIYNLVLAMPWRHPMNINLDKAKVVRYCAVPWRYTGKEQNMDTEDIRVLMIQKWWDIYNDESLDYKNCSSPAASEVVPEADEDVKHMILQRFLKSLREAARCCSINDLCLEPFLAAVSEAGCFSTGDLSLQPFLEVLWQVGCGVVEDLTSLAELCGGFMCCF